MFGSILAKPLAPGSASEPRPEQELVSFEVSSFLICNYLLDLPFRPHIVEMAQALNGLYKAAIPLAVGAAFLQASIYDVKGGTRAVIFDRYSGVKDTVVNEGTHFLVPWLQKSIIYDVRTKPRNISTTTGSKDLQMVSLTLRVLHRPEVQQLPKIYQVSFEVNMLINSEAKFFVESWSRLR
jgi:hypothetical protein